MRWIAVRALTAAALGAVLLAVALIAPVATADTAPPVVSRVTVPLAVTVYDPCTAELVSLAGTLNFEALATVLEDGQVTLKFKVQGTDVAGSGLSTVAPYRLVGEGHGANTDFTGQDRAVTAADFAVVATANPGTTLGRAQAQPAATIVLRVAISEGGLVERVGAESVVVDRDCA